MSAARFGAALAMLWAAHDLADHVVQTDHQAANKASDWPAMAGHVGSYTIVQGLALVGLRGIGVRPRLHRTVAAVAFSAASHAFLDRRWPVRRALELTGSPGFARGQVPDQQVLFTEYTEPIVVGEPGHEITLQNRSSTAQVPAHPVPLHGPYLADQALHHACLTVCAAILAGGDR